MSNKAHLRPHQKIRHASWMSRLLVVIAFIAIFALAIALAASGRGAPLSNLRLLSPSRAGSICNCGRYHDHRYISRLRRPLTA